MAIQRTPMTRQGYDRLKEELERLKRVERHAISRAIAEARINELEAKVGTAEVLDPPSSGDRVIFGSTVRLEDQDGKEARYQIVGSDETDPSRGRISVMAPLARTLIGKRVGDSVVAQLPGGKKRFEILDANFPWPDAGG